jgi:Na+-driven multidrug efflux pump
MSCRFNVIGAISAWLGDDEVAAFNIAYKIIYLVHQFGMSVGIGTNIRVSNMLGAGDIVGAKRNSWAGMTLSCGITFILAIVVFIWPVELASIFSSDPVIHEIFRSIAGYLAVTLFFMSTSDALEQVCVPLVDSVGSRYCSLLLSVCLVAGLSALNAVCRLL